MKYVWLNNPLDPLHWQVLKNTLLILLLLPVINLGKQFIGQFQMADQIVVYFYALSFATAAFILAFYTALKTLHSGQMPATSRIEQYLLYGYRHVPMLCLTGSMVHLSASLF